MSGREGRWAPQGETARSHRDWTSMSWETITTPPSSFSCSFLLRLSTTILFFLSLALTLSLFHPSPGALYTPLFIYVSGDGNGLPPREEGWEGGELWVCAHGVLAFVCSCRNTVYTIQYVLWCSIFQGRPTLWRLWQLVVLQGKGFTSASPFSLYHGRTRWCTCRRRDTWSCCWFHAILLVDSCRGNTQRKIARCWEGSEDCQLSMNVGFKIFLKNSWANVL